MILVLSPFYQMLELEMKSIAVIVKRSCLYGVPIDLLVAFISKYCSQRFKNFQCICFIFKIPALKIVDPALIHVEVVHDNFVMCGKTH